MIEADRDKIIKILRMFSSNHDGEVVSAARRVHDLIKTRALDWDDLIIKIGQAEQQQQQDWQDIEDDETFQIRRCGELSRSLTEWEQEFIISIGTSIIEWGRLTPKQLNVLNRIVTKLQLRGLWDKT